MKKTVLIVAGGSGNRMNAEVPKQFLSVNGYPLLMHTFKAFMRFRDNLDFVLVLPESEFATWNELCDRYRFEVPHKLVKGGDSRFRSVKNGLAAIDEEGIVFIHDGVRPLVSKRTLTNCLQTALEKGNALPVIPVTESVRQTEGEDNTALDRSKFVLVQTPQTFSASLIKKAYETRDTEEFTDDASVLEASGEKIHLVEGNRENIKITYPEDIHKAEALLRMI